MTLPTDNTRHHALDGLRGSLALAVVFYHLLEALALALPLPAWLDATGLMGVDAFFVLSGYALARVYWKSDFRSPAVLARYLARRVLRIAPLLYLATLSVAAPAYFLGALALLLVCKAVFARQALWLAASQAAVVLGLLGWRIVMQQLPALPTVSLLWGFVDPSLSIAGGSWSIGVELVFYALLPPLLLAARRQQRRIAALLAVAVGVAIAWQLRHDTALLPMSAGMAAVKAHWQAYVSVYNHAAFFVAGVALYAWTALRPGLSPVRAWGLLGACAAAYAGAATVLGMPDHGTARAVFSVLTFGIVAACTGLRVTHAGTVHACAFLGEISYGVYLLHFPVQRAVQTYAQPATAWAELGLTVVLTLVAASVVRVIYEKSFAWPARTKPARDPLPPPLEKRGTMLAR